TRPMHRDTMNTVADFGSRVGDLLGAQAAVHGRPGFAAIFGSEHARSRNGDEHSLWLTRVENDRVQAQSASARLPCGCRAVAAKPRELLPRLPRVGRAE